MAQIVKLKRTSVAGKVPATSNIQLGELAMNTYDGRIFFEKNTGGTETVEEIVTTDSENPITGSINLNGPFTSSGVLVSANIMPTTDNNLSLGSSTKRFQLNGGTPVTVDGSGTANTLTRFQSATTVEDSNIVSSDTATTLTHSNNGNIIFTVSGSNGELLTVTDSNSGNLLEVNDTSGIDVFTVSAIGDVSASGAITASGIMIIDNVSVTGNISGSSFNGTGLLSGSITNQLPSGVVSSSAFSSPSQGTVRATINGTQTNVDTGLQTGDSPQFTNLTLTGNLTVQGTTTTENSQQVNIGDNIINLNYGGSSTTGGIYVKDGTGASTTSGSLLWDATNDYWKAGKLGSEEEILLRNTHGVVSGSVLRPNGDNVISGSDQLDGFVSKSADFTANELLVADGTNSVISSNILSLDTTNNYLGINQSNPSVTLHMTGEGAQSAQIRMEQHNDSSDAPDIRTRKSRGTAAAPTKNNAGDFIYRQNSERYNGSSYVTVGQLAVDTNSTNADRFQLSLAVSEDGNGVDAADAQFVIDGNDNGAITFNDSYKFPTSDGTNGQTLVTNGSGVLSFGAPTADLNGTGVISGSAQITDLTTYKETVSGASSYAVDHNLNEQYPIVQVWNTSTLQQVIPDSITTNSVNRVTVAFNHNFAGVIIVKK